MAPRWKQCVPPAQHKICSISLAFASFQHLYNTRFNPPDHTTPSTSQPTTSPMPSINHLTLASLATSSTLASTIPSKRWGPGDPGCMTWDQAQKVASNWAQLIATYTPAAADAYLTPDFTDYSESVNTLINSCPQGAHALTLPLLAPTFSSREEFKAGQGEQPPINFEQLQMWHTCNTVTVRWETTNTAPIPDVKPVVGIFVVETVPGPDGGEAYQIERAYSEFDAGAWLQNLMEWGICGTSGSSSTASSSSIVGSTTMASTSVLATSTVDTPTIITAVSSMAATMTAGSYASSSSASWSA